MISTKYESNYLSWNKNNQISEFLKKLSVSHCQLFYVGVTFLYGVFFTDAEEVSFVSRKPWACLLAHVLRGIGGNTHSSHCSSSIPGLCWKSKIKTGKPHFQPLHSMPDVFRWFPVVKGIHLGHIHQLCFIGGKWLTFFKSQVSHV